MIKRARSTYILDEHELHELHELIEHGVPIFKTKTNSTNCTND